MKKPSLTVMTQQKPGAFSLDLNPQAPAPRPADTEAVADVDDANSEDAAVADDGTRHRVVVRLNLEAVEALDEIAKDLRRKTGRSVAVQKVMEEAVALVLKKYKKDAKVLPAPAKR